MAMQHIENELIRSGDPRKQAFADVIAGIHKSLGSDIPFPSAVTPVSDATAAVEKSVAPISEAPVEIKKSLSRDQPILPETSLPQEVSEVLKRAEKAGIDIFEPYCLSGVTLSRNSNVLGWDRKPEDWYWEQIKNGKIDRDAAKLPDAWILIDRTQKPNYNRGRQLYQNDPFGNLLKQLRKEGKIEKTKGLPEASRFRISHDELTQVVLPEVAKILGVDASQVRLPKEIEFNIIGNFKHPEWGNTNTWEWFADKFGDDGRLIGGYSGYGGLAHVYFYWHDDRSDGIGFRPLVVVSSKA